MAQRRVTDAAELDQPAPHRAQAPRRGLRARRQRPRVVAGHPVARAVSPPPSTSRPTSRSPAPTVVAAADSPSGDLLAGWLAARLRCPVTARPLPQPQRDHLGAARARQRHGRPRAPAATATRPRCPSRASPYRTIALAHRGDAECLADELRRLDPDEVYQDALTTGLRQVHACRGDGERGDPRRAGPRRWPRPSARSSGCAAPPGPARSSTMVEAQPMPPKADDPTAGQEGRRHQARRRSRSERS